MEKIQKLLDAIHTNPDAKSLTATMAAPSSHEDIVAGYARMAEAVGFDITPEEISSGIRALEAARRRLTAEAEAKIALSDDNLDLVAGGAAQCQETYTPGEWCWYTDSCNAIVYTY